MGGEPVGAHVGPVDQPALHHVPAEQALAAAEHADGEHRETEPEIEGAADQEPEEGQHEGDPHRPAQQPMRVLEPEDRLELRQRHAEVDRLVLGEALVVGEERLPRVGADGRERAHQRAPVHHGEAGLVEPGDAAEHHHRQHQAGEAEQPPGDGAPPAVTMARHAGWSRVPEVSFRRGAYRLWPRRSSLRHART